MKENKILHTLFSGTAGTIIGVLLTIGYQYFFPQEQSFTFIIDGEKVALTEPELQEQLDATQNELDSTKDELASTSNELNELKTKINEKELVDVSYSDFLLNVNGESKNEYKNGMLDIEGKNYVLLSTLDQISNEEIQYANDTLYIGHSIGEVVSLMDVCPPYDYAGKYSYSEESFKMEGELYNDGFTMRNSNKNYAVINLKNQFSNISFDFGHVDASNNTNCTLNIYLDESLVKTINKQSDSMVSHESISLNYAKQLKFEFVASNDSGIYGIGAIKLQY